VAQGAAAQAVAPGGGFPADGRVVMGEPLRG